jgi:glycosyltransferase involved in cell wall biosynthesis
VARVLGFPVALQVHELPQPGRKRNATLTWAAAVADVLIAVATPVGEMLREHAGGTPVVTVRNGVPEVDVRRGAVGPIVGTVGYVSRGKGTDLFLRAAELALAARSELRFEHVGQHRLWGDDRFDRSIEERAASPALRGALTLVGRASVGDTLARWEIFVLASRSEGFPLSTLEAMAAGLPVIAADVGGVSEQISHLETGILVPPERPAEIAEWIVRLHDDPSLRSRLGEAARDRVRASFTLSAQAEGLNEAYELALRRHSSRRVRLPRVRFSATR